MEFYIAMKKNKVLVHSTTWMNLTSTTLHNRSWKEYWLQDSISTELNNGQH